MSMPMFLSGMGLGLFLALITVLICMGIDNNKGLEPHWVYKK